MTVGVILVGLGLLGVLYAFLSYKRADHNLAAVKKEDLVSYYLDLALSLIPFPFYSLLLGIFLVFVGLIVVIVNIPVVF